MLDLQVDYNTAHIRDAVSGDTIVVYYRTPTTREMTAYSSGLFHRKGKKVVNKAAETRVKLARKIITGFRDGDIGLGGKPISSDPRSADYYENWLDLLTEKAPHILTALAYHVFESTRAEEPDNEDEDDLMDDDLGEGDAPEDEEDDLPPLPRNSLD